MTDSTHECPAPGCELRVRFDRLACVGHWKTIPWDVQKPLLRLWRDEPGSDEYFAARADCLRSLGVPEGDLADLNAGVT